MKPKKSTKSVIKKSLKKSLKKSRKTKYYKTPSSKKVNRKYINLFIGGGPGKTGSYDVSKIKFTQKTISHTFSNSASNLTDWLTFIKNKVGGITEPFPPFDYQTLISNLGLPDDFFRLDVIVDTTGRVYSCNNRRLCLLKKLKGLGIFDGVIVITQVAACSHDVETDVNPETGPLTQMGNRRGVFCSNL